MYLDNQPLTVSYKDQYKLKKCGCLLC